MAIAFPAVAASIPATLRLTVSGPERVLYNQVTEACDASDLPDAPARAFRDASGDMVLFAPNFRNRAFSGPNLDHLTHDCAIRFAAAGSADPALLDDRTWLHAFHTDDGQNIFALASASFIPYRHGVACAAGEARTDCWINGLAAVESHDGGRTFAYLGTPPGHIVFPPPMPYRGDVADPPGFMTATNFVRWQGDLYTIVWRRGDGRERSRNCLARAPGADVRHWQLWSGRAFVAASDFVDGTWRVSTTDCVRVGPAGVPAIRGLVRHAASGTFVAVFQYREGKGPAAARGFYTATSRDLVAWSRPQPLLSADLQPDATPGKPWVAYPSIIDDTSSDRDFGTIGAKANLLFVRIVSDAKTGRTTRSLIAIPICAEPES